uniref:Uncharacterized protein n=1 Tax=Oryza barthii TaxID=65489 RepID=A0A0D3HWW9_9ORYZ
MPRPSDKQSRQAEKLMATEASSMGLNAAFSCVSSNSQSKAHSSEGCESLGIPEATLVPSLRYSRHAFQTAK